MVAIGEQGRNVHSPFEACRKTGGLQWPSRANHEGCRVLSAHDGPLPHQGCATSWTDRASRYSVETERCDGCESAFPIGDEILLHWVSAGIRDKEGLLYLALLALLWAPWSLIQDDEDVL